MDMDLQMKTLRRSFLKLGSNYDVEYMENLQKGFEEYLESYEDTSDKKMENTVHLLKALINYIKTDHIPSSYEFLSPVAHNLEFCKNVGYLKLKANYNKSLSIASISICKDYKQAFCIVENLHKIFESYPIDGELQDKTLATAYINFADRLLYAKAFEEHSEEELTEITKLFNRFADKGKALCEKLDKLNWFAILLVKESLFKDSRKLFRQAMTISRSLKEAELYKRIDADISKYAILTVKEDSNPTIKEIVKAVLVNARAKKGMTIFDLALKIEIPSSHIRDFELGKKDLKFETLEKIAKALDLDLKEFYR